MSDSQPAPNQTVTILPDGPTPTPVIATEVPARIGRFEVRRFLGEGAFGRVYEAYDPSLKRTVALKMAKPEQLAGDRRLARFQREAQAAANLLHPHIVAVFDHGEDGPHHYIATAFIVGQALDRRSGPLPLREAAAIVRKLAEALAYAHKSGVIHRDVKPANVMLREDGEPLLMDFGLAARHDEQEKLTQDGQVMGTPEYLAPEQWHGKAEAASDQYSLGCVLYELLTGRTPFGGGSAAQYAMLHLTQTPPSPRAVRMEVPRDLETVCLKCLEKEPARRYADCQALADDLRRWLDGEPVSARRPGPVERLAKWARRSPAVASMVAVTLVTLTTGVAFSTYFGVKAGQREKYAIAKEEEARTALRRTQEALADGLLRPLGHSDLNLLTVYEREPLDELAGLPPEEDAVRLLFLERALGQARKAKQLSRVSPDAVAALVGLRREFRERVAGIVTGRLIDVRSPVEVKLASARILAELGWQDPASARRGLEVLLEEVARTYSGSLQQLQRQCVHLAERVTTPDSKAICKVTLTQAAKVTDPDQLTALAQAFAALAPRLERDQAARDAAALAREVVSQAAKVTDLYHLPALAQAFAALAPRLEPAAFLDLSDSLGREILLDDRTTLKLTPLLPNDVLLDLLKRPGVARYGKPAIVEEFGKRFKRKFRDEWDLAEYLERHHPELDVAAPMRRPRR